MTTEDVAKKSYRSTITIRNSFVYFMLLFFILEHLFALIVINFLFFTIFIVIFLFNLVIRLINKDNEHKKIPSRKEMHIIHPEPAGVVLENFLRFLKKQKYKILIRYNDTVILEKITDYITFIPYYKRNNDDLIFINITEGILKIDVKEKQISGMIKYVQKLQSPIQEISYKIV